MVFQQVFEQAGGDRHSQVRIRMSAPTLRKWPENLWSGLHEFSDGDNGLPARIDAAVRRRFTR